MLSDTKIIDLLMFFFFKQKTAYEMRISDWSSDVCSSDLFNLAQCEGLRPGLAPDPEPLPEREIVPVAEEVIAASGVDFRTGGAKAYYVQRADYVQVPPQPAFYEQINFYRTALHELCHASAHTSRLNPPPPHTTGRDRQRST